MTEPLQNESRAASPLSAEPGASPSRIARNTVWNFAGQLLPAFIALFTIPPLIRGLGTDRFGLLTIAWVVMGYFGVFDLGLGRATTTAVAVAITKRREVDLRNVVTSSIAAHVVVGLLGGVILWFASPSLGAFLSVPAKFEAEAVTIFRLLAISVPVVVMTSSVRGILEALHRFDLVNLVKMPASALNYVAPIVVLLATNSLVVIVAVVVVARVVVLGTYMWLARLALERPLLGGSMSWEVIGPLFSFGGWVTISNMLTTAIAAVDRFVIGARISVGAVTYYATPYEVFSRLYIVSSSVTAVMFPIFSAMSVEDRPQDLRRLSSRSARVMLLLIAPPIIFLIPLAEPLLRLWLGEELAVLCASPARIFLAGILISTVAQAPYTLLQATGRADVVALRKTLTFIVYLPMTWHLASFGVSGVAIAWLLRIILETALLFDAERRHARSQDEKADFSRDLSMIPMSVMFLAAAATVFVASSGLAALIVGATAAAAGAGIAGWLMLLDRQDREETRVLLIALRDSRRSA